MPAGQSGRRRCGRGISHSRRPFSDRSRFTYKCMGEVGTLWGRKFNCDTKETSLKLLKCAYFRLNEYETAMELTNPAEMDVPQRCSVPDCW